MNDNDSVANDFLKRLGTLYNVLSFLLMVWFCLYVLYRIPCNLALRMMACICFSYGFVGFVMCSASDWYPDYWPALSEYWTDQGKVGQPCHSSAVLGDIGLSMIASWLFYWISTLIGRTETTLNGTEIFIASDS